jgi:hypothetical protein
MVCGLVCLSPKKRATFLVEGFCSAATVRRPPCNPQNAPLPPKAHRQPVLGSTERDERKQTT